MPFWHAAPGIEVLQGLLTSLTNNQENYIYAYDVNGNITRIVWGDNQKDNGYEYDSLNQMVREEIIRDGVTRIIEYTYDDLGNMDTRTEGGTEYTYSYTCDPLTNITRRENEVVTETTDLTYEQATSSMTEN